MSEEDRESKLLNGVARGKEGEREREGEKGIARVIHLGRERERGGEMEVRARAPRQWTVFAHPKIGRRRKTGGCFSA